MAQYSVFVLKNTNQSSNQPRQLTNAMFTVRFCVTSKVDPHNLGQ